MRIVTLTKIIPLALLAVGLLSASCGSIENFSPCTLGTHRTRGSTTCVPDVDAGPDGRVDGVDAHPDGDGSSCPPDHGELNCVHAFGDAGGIIACGDVGAPSLCVNGHRVCGPGAVPFSTCTCTLCAPTVGADGGQPDSTKASD